MPDSAATPEPGHSRTPQSCARHRLLGALCAALATRALVRPHEPLHGLSQWGLEADRHRLRHAVGSCSVSESAYLGGRRCGRARGDGQVARDREHPGCDELAAPASGPGRPPEHCEGRGHTKVSAWRERRRLAAAEAGTTTSPADTDSPLTIAKVTGAELLRALRAEADRVSGIADRLRQAVETVTDPTAAEAEVEAIRAAAEQRAAVAEAAAEEMAVQMNAAQVRVGQAEAARAAAEADRDAAIEKARAEASQQVRAAEADRDQALAQAAQADQATRLAQQVAARAQAAEQAARAETGRVRDDAEKMLTGFRADADRDRDELRLDLRARAERAERQADAYRDELTQLRAETSHDTDTTTSRTPRRTRQATQP